MYTYKTKGVCSREIKFEVKNDKVTELSFIGGCDGNLQGLSRLVEGLDVNDAIKKLKGIDCGGRGTSCPDQLSRALEEFVAKNK